MPEKVQFIFFPLLFCSMFSGYWLIDWFLINTEIKWNHTFHQHMFIPVLNRPTNHFKFFQFCWLELKWTHKTYICIFLLSTHFKENSALLLMNCPIYSYSATQETSQTQAPLMLVLESNWLKQRGVQNWGIILTCAHTYTYTYTYTDAGCIHGQDKGLWRTDISVPHTSKKQSTKWRQNTFTWHPLKYQTVFAIPSILLLYTKKAKWNSPQPNILACSLITFYLIQ